jgi:hypothetical protein
VNEGNNGLVQFAELSVYGPVEALLVLNCSFRCGFVSFQTGCGVVC